MLTFLIKALRGLPSLPDKVSVSLGLLPFSGSLTFQPRGLLLTSSVLCL